MSMPEVTNCQWCGAEVLESGLEQHWEENQCAERGMQDIMSALKESGKTVKDPDATVFLTERRAKYNTFWGRLLFKIFRHPHQDIIWTWLKPNATPHEQAIFKNKIEKYQAKGYELRWMTVKQRKN
jgi:hypothetical protein